MLQHLKTVTALKRDEKGVTALEYGLIASLIAVVIIGAVSTLGTNLSSTFNNIATHLGSVAADTSSNAGSTGTATKTPTHEGTAIRSAEDSSAVLQAQ